MTIPDLLRPRPIRWGVACYVLVSLVCTRIPLVNYLGYEFAFVMAWAVAVIAGWTTIRAVSTAMLAPEGTITTTARAFRETLGANIVLLLIPLSIMSANAAIVKNCSFIQGLEFFIALPAVTALFACSLALFCAVLNRHPKVSYAVISIATVAYALGAGYWTPAIYSYNFFYGYFPGLTYDEILELHWPLILFRVFTLGIAVLLVWMSSLLLRVAKPGASVTTKGLLLVREMMSPGNRTRSLLAAVILVGTYTYRCDLGFESTSSYVQRSLGAIFTTDHFTIYYDSVSIVKDEIRQIGQEHEFRLAQIQNAFLLPHRGRIESYVYPSAQAKQRMIGAGLTSIAKPWRREVHCSKQSLDAVLKHELTHVVAGVFGVPVFRASLSPGLTEGLATSLEPGWGTRTLHQYAASIQRAGLLPDMRRMMTFRGFFEQSSSVSYILAGSFCRYLTERFGMKKLTQVYGGGDYVAVYGRSLEELLREWDRYLVLVRELPGDDDVVDALFRRPPIFGKVCARVIAEQNSEARRMFASKEYHAAAAMFSESYREAGSFEALAGWVASALRAGQYNELIAVHDTIIARAKRPAEYLPLALPIGDAFWASGDPMSALRLYDRLERAELSPSQTESAIVRALAIDDEQCATGLLQFFLSNDSDAVRLSLLDSLSTRVPADELVQYLRGKTLIRLRRFEEGLLLLNGVRLEDTDVRLESARCLGIAEALFHLKKYQDAKAAFWVSLNVRFSDSVRAYVDDWVERCDWMAEHGGL